MQYLKIGQTKKTHGIKGELKVQIDEIYEDLFFEQERVFLDIRGSKQPYFIESIRGGGDLIVHFDDVPTREDALLLQGRGIYLLAEEVPEMPAPEDTNLVYQRITGYLLSDQRAGELGTVEEVIEMPMQELAKVRYKGREVLIPLNEAFVQSIDDAAKHIVVDLPEGLLDL